MVVPIHAAILASGNSSQRWHRFGFGPCLLWFLVGPSPVFTNVLCTPIAAFGWAVWESFHGDQIHSSVGGRQNLRAFFVLAFRAEKMETRGKRTGPIFCKQTRWTLGAYSVLLPLWFKFEELSSHILP
jgi:hypothetical protein